MHHAYVIKKDKKRNCNIQVAFAPGITLEHAHSFLAYLAENWEEYEGQAIFATSFDEERSQINFVASGVAYVDWSRQDDQYYIKDLLLPVQYVALADRDDCIFGIDEDPRSIIKNYVLNELFKEAVHAGDGFRQGLYADFLNYNYRPTVLDYIDDMLNADIATNTVLSRAVDYVNTVND